MKKKWTVRAYLWNEKNPQTKQMDLVRHVSLSMLKRYMDIMREEEGVDMPATPPEPWLFHLMMTQVKSTLPKFIKVANIEITDNR